MKQRVCYLFIGIYALPLWRYKIYMLMKQHLKMFIFLLLGAVTNVLVFAILFLYEVREVKKGRQQIVLNDETALLTFASTLGIGLGMYLYTTIMYG